MRIDLTSSPTPEIERGRSSAGTANTNITAENQGIAGKEDEARLSTGRDAVAGLKAQLSTVPEIRQDRVAGLREAIRSGNFRISPEGIANKMLSEGTNRAG